MRVRVESRAGRILRHLEWYRDFTRGSVDIPPWIQEVSLLEGERCLGVYENVPGQASESVLVTTLGLHLRRNDHWEFVAYDQIESVKAVGAKVEVIELGAQLRDGRVTRIPVRGGQGRLRDAWEFLRYLMRVTEDLQRQDVPKTSPDPSGG